MTTNPAKARSFCIVATHSDGKISPLAHRAELGVAEELLLAGVGCWNCKPLFFKFGSESIWRSGHAFIPPKIIT